LTHDDFIPIATPQTHCFHDKIGELWEAKCEQLEIELIATKLGTKQLKGLNEDSHEVTEELKEEAMFLQMNIRRFEQRAEFAEGIIDKLEHNCEKLNDSLFVENSKFMDLSLKLENGGNMQNIQQNQVQNQVEIRESLIEDNATPIPEIEQNNVHQDRLRRVFKLKKNGGKNMLKSWSFHNLFKTQLFLKDRVILAS